MGYRVKRSAELFKCSWQVLRSDKQLALFPIISAAATLLLAASFLAPILSVPALRSDAWTFASDMRHDHQALESEQGRAPDPEPATNATSDSATADGTTDRPPGSPAPELSALDIGFLLYGFIFYLACSFVVIFFNAALVGAANRKFEGEPTGVMIGIRIAIQRLPQILAWSLVSALIGTILRTLEQNMGTVGKIVIALLGVAWGIASYFAVPTLVVEGVGPIRALRNSVGAIKRTWGESLVIAIGFGCIGGLVTMAGICMLVAGGLVAGMLASQDRVVEAATVGGIIFSSGLAVLILWSVLSYTLMAITRTALYRYAVDGVIPGGFNEEALAAAFVNRKQKT